MNSSAFFTLRCVIYLISLQLYAIVLSSFSGSTIYYRGCNCHEIMPVLTRSKARLLHASINEDENNNISDLLFLRISLLIPSPTGLSLVVIPRSFEHGTCLSWLNSLFPLG
jgi:hypothetical protein